MGYNQGLADFFGNYNNTNTGTGLYKATMNGVPVTVGQNALDKVDAGSVSAAMMDGKVYSNGTVNDLNGAIGSDWTDAKNWGINGLGGAVLGGLNFGLGLLSYLDNKKTAKLQRKAMKQTIEANKYNMNKTKADTAHLAKVFGTSTPTYVG